MVRGRLRVYRVAGRFRARFHCEHRELKIDPEGARRTAERALALVAELSPDIAPICPAFVQALTLFADITNLPLSRRLQRRIAHRGSGRQDPGWEAGTLRFGRAKLYNKVAEITANPRKAYIRKCWSDPTASRVTRIEIRFDRSMLAHHGLDDLNRLWSHGLDNVSLRVDAQGKRKGRPRARRPEAPLWRRLRRLTFAHVGLDGARVAAIRDAGVPQLSTAMKLALRNLAVCLIRCRGSPQTTTRILAPFAELLGADLANLEAQIAEYRRIYEGRLSPQDPEASKGGGEDLSV